MGHRGNSGHMSGYREHMVDLVETRSLSIVTIGGTLINCFWIILRHQF